MSRYLIYSSWCKNLFVYQDLNVRIKFFTNRIKLAIEEISYDVANQASKYF